jgi:alkylhydroperoxidase family enzyme
MARLPLVREQDMTAEQRAQFERFPSNLTRALLLAVPRLAQALPATANALRDAGLDPKLREGVILRVAHLCGSAYERMQHLGPARAAVAPVKPAAPWASMRAISSSRQPAARAWPRCCMRS